MVYKTTIDRKCEAVLNQLTAESRERHMGYDKP